MDPISKLTQEVKELQRQVPEIIRLAQVTEVNIENARLTCESEGLIQSDIPFFTFRAGEDQTYWLPSVGELGYLLSPSGNTGNAVFLPGIFYDTFPPADMSATKAKRIFRGEDSVIETIETETPSFTVEVGNSKIIIDGEAVESKHGDANSIKVDGSASVIARTGGKVQLKVGSNLVDLSMIALSMLGAQLYNSGLTSFQTAMGPVFFAPIPPPPSAPSPPAMSNPNSDGEATQIPPSDVDNIIVKSSSRLQFTIPPLPVTTTITGVAGPYPVVATGAGQTASTPINVTVSGEFDITIPAKGL